MQNTRPLSPHLGIYKPQISSVLSILHRITGVALSFGCLLLVAWLWAAAYNPNYFEQIQSLGSEWWAKLLLLGWAAAFYYHLASGIRHLFWDMGKGYELKTMARTGWMVLIFAGGMTALTVCSIW